MKKANVGKSFAHPAAIGPLAAAPTLAAGATLKKMRPQTDNATNIATPIPTPQENNTNMATPRSMFMNLVAAERLLFPFRERCKTWSFF